MAEIPKLVENSNSLSKIEFGDMGMKKIAVSDQDESSVDSTGMSDSFIVDIENLSNSPLKDNISANSRISVKLQRNLSRKGSLRGERIRSPLASSPLASTMATEGSFNGNLTSGGCDPDKSSPSPRMSSGVKDSINNQPQQTITITAENRCSSTRKYLKQRTSFIDPRRVLLFFATLSSMGTIMLIYFTLCISKISGDNSSTQAQ